jgi:hypothetical protein
MRAAPEIDRSNECIEMTKQMDSMEEGEAERCNENSRIAACDTLCRGALLRHSAHEAWLGGATTGFRSFR